MSKPSPLDFTVVHVRVVVPPDQAQRTALVLMSSVFPRYSDTTPLDAALKWFGTNLSISPEPDDVLKSSRLRTAHSLRRRVEYLAENSTPLVLDLVQVTHTAVLRPSYRNLESRTCGYAALSLPGTEHPPHIVTRNINYGADQLHVAYQPLYSSSPGDTLTAVSQAVHATPSSTRPVMVPLADLLCGRAGVPTDDGRHSTSIYSVAVFSDHAGDDHPIWTLVPERIGTDITYDSHVASLSDTAYYRVFDARTNTSD